ncbi:Tyrosine-protein kinase [Dirofilaria immitis]|nr:Tyrosine-protein kinase [Dirofilaria immitis]
MTQPEEKSKSFTFNDLPKMMLDESCYHGLLPREDLPCLLEQVGDFLIRITQLKPGDPHEFVLSLRVSDEDSPSAIRHVVIHRQKRKDGKIEWLTNEQNKFDSIKELINAYVSSKKPINPEIRTSQLIRPVARQSWEFLHENITLKEVLGEGQFGEAKTIKDKKQLEQAKEKVKEMMHEARLMRYFDHENVVKIHGVAVCREPLMIIIEMVKGGCLSDVLECRKGKIDEIEKVENMSLGSARGLEYIHIQGIIHRDIAARNVLYTEQKVAKISDFGMSRQAPESMVTYQYTPKTDVFSFSILLWEIFSDGEEPYKGMTSIEVKRMISCGERLKKPEGCPDFMFQIMGKCWEQNPDNRYSMSQVVKHIEDIVEHAYSEISDSPAAVNTEVCLSVEKLGSKDEVNDWNGHPSIISSRSRKRRKKHHRRRKRHKKSRMHKSERKKAMSRRRQMKSTHNGL